MAPEVLTHWLGSIMCKLLLTSGRDGSSVELIALAIIIVLGRQKLATFVASRAVRVPNVMYRQEFLIWIWLGGAVDIYGSAVWCLPWVVLRKTDVTILLVAKSYHASRGSLESRAIFGLSLCLLRWHAHRVCVEDLVRFGSAVRR